MLKLEAWRKLGRIWWWLKVHIKQMFLLLEVVLVTDVCSDVSSIITLVSHDWQSSRACDWVTALLDDIPVKQYFGSSSSSIQLPRRQMNRPTLLLKLRFLGPTRSPRQPWKESRMRRCQVDWSTRWVMSCHMGQNQPVIVNVIYSKKMLIMNDHMKQCDQHRILDSWVKSFFAYLNLTKLLLKHLVCFVIRCVFSPNRVWTSLLPLSLFFLNNITFP